MKKFDRDFIKILKLLKKSKKSDLLILLENLDLKTINNICILIHNLEYTSNNLSQKNQRKLKEHMLKHRNTCKFLANANNNIYKKKTLMKKQVGNGLISALLGIGIPLLTSLLSKRK